MTSALTDLDAPVVREGVDDCPIPCNGPEKDAIIPSVGMLEVLSASRPSV